MPQALCYASLNLFASAFFPMLLRRISHHAWEGKAHMEYDREVEHARGLQASAG